MPYYYTDQKREEEKGALPDVEVFEQRLVDEKGWPYMNEDSSKARGMEPGFYYAHGSPGCLWDSDPIGPFDSEEEALKEAREAS